MRIILLNLVYSLLKFLSGYRLTPQATETILKRYSRVLPRGGGEACLCAFDDFVSVSVRLRAYTGTVYCSCILEQLLKIQNPWITSRLNSSSLPQRLYCNIHKNLVYSMLMSEVKFSKCLFFLPDAFRKRDAMLHGQETGNCTFQYDDVSIVMN